MRQRGKAAAEMGRDQHFRLLAESAVEYAVFMLDPQGRVVDWNCGPQRLHGYTAAEIIGRHVGVLFTPEDLTQGVPDKILDDARRRGKSVGAGWRLRKNGERFPVRAEVSAFRDPSGTVLGFGYVARDMSEQQALDDVRSAARRDQDARGRAEFDNQTTSDFLAMISHEIRTPLTGIKGFADILVEQDLSPVQRRYVELARSSCAALMMVVDDVLDFSKIESGQVDLHPEPLSLAVLAHNALSTVLGTAGPKGLSLSVTIAPDVPTLLLGDAGRLRQILLNLLTNAVKFTLRGGVTLAVTHEGTRPDGECVKFAVIDTGIGIPENRLERLFNRFSQADKNIRNRFGGTGLGLAICKQLVERMGGEVGVETALGRGSTFWFKVTLPPSSAIPARPVESMPAAAAAKNVRLLVVEDRAMNQEIARVFLEHAGYDVQIVDSGRGAIAAVQAGRFDAVLMDMQMPEMDGLEATRRIRALGGDLAQMPIIALSARVLPEDIAQCRAAGMNDHIGKPFDREQMYRVIDHWTAGP
jgi:PAS domain S-box-containing protein